MAVVILSVAFLILIPLVWIIIFDLNHNDRSKDEKN